MIKPTVYAIFSHINPAQVIRLVRTLRALSPRAHIVVHHDPGHTRLDGGHVVEAGGLMIPDPVAGEWGDFSCVQQHLHVQRWCRDHLDFEWFVTLTGQTYPIKPLAQLETMLAQSTYDAFVEHFTAYDPMVWPSGEAVRRYHYRYFKLPKFRYWHRVPRGLRDGMPKLIRSLNAIQPWIRVFTYPRGLPTRLGLRTIKRPFGPRALQLFGGNQNTTFRHSAIDFILSYVDSHPEYSAYFRRTALPDEGFFATILCNSDHIRIANDSLRHIHWPPGNVANVAVMNMAHLPALEKSSAYFGLKFDQDVCPELLHRIDRWLGLPDSN